MTRSGPRGSWEEEEEEDDDDEERSPSSGVSSDHLDLDYDSYLSIFGRGSRRPSHETRY